MTARVLLDLNLPAFQDVLLALEPNEVRALFKTLRKLRGQDWQQVYRDPGLKWERIKGAPGKFTVRLTRSCRAIVQRDGDFMRCNAIWNTTRHTARGEPANGMVALSQTCRQEPMRRTCPAPGAILTTRKSVK